MRRDDRQGPGPFLWLVAFVSLALPWAAAFLAVAGLWQVARGIPDGWWYVAGAGGLLIADIVIDYIWARSSVLGTDRPDLNSRATQLVGRVGTVEEAIVHGRGRVRLGDTLWAAEGPDAPAASRVRVVGARGPVLLVEKV